MAITEFNLKIENRRVRHDYTGLVTFEREYEAILDAPATTDDEVLADPMCPAMYSVHTGAPLVPSIVTHRTATSMGSTRLHYRVLITYGQQAIDPYSSGDEAFDRDRYDESNFLKQEVVWNFVPRSVPIQRGRLYAVERGGWLGIEPLGTVLPSAGDTVPLTTSAMLGYSPLPTGELLEPAITVTRNELLANVSVDILTYPNTINDKQVTIGGVPIKALAAKMGPIQISSPKKDNQSGAIFVTVTLPIKLRSPHRNVRLSDDYVVDEMSGWDITLLDQDHYRLTYDEDAGEAKAERIVDGIVKDDMDRPSLLNGRGEPLVFNTDPPTEQELRDKACYRCYRPEHIMERDWSPLSLR